jgi:GGDEF domain-containing protein
MGSEILRRFTSRLGSSRARAVDQARRQAEAGRRLSIYDRETGFLAPWYLLLRAREEMVRSRRYGSPLTLLVIEAPQERWPKLNGWLGASLRMTDMVCRDTSGTYFVLLTETAEAGASTVAKRLIAEVPVSRLSLRAFEPGDENGFRSLLAPLEDRWPLRQPRAA